MFTPQQLEQITFHTSVFGGYDMDSVDEFPGGPDRRLQHAV